MQKIKRSKHPIPTFAKMLDTFLTDELCSSPRRGATLWNNTMPAVNVREDDNQYELEIAAPGYVKTDFHINIDQEVLTISSKKEVSKEEKENGKYTRREFSYSSFKRSFDLPETVDSTKIAANYNNGILSVVIPKKEEAKPVPARKIEIS